MTSIEIRCENCTKSNREGGKWNIETFYSLTNAVQHIVETKHEVIIELRTETEDD